MNRKKVSAIFARLKAANPHPTTELEYSTPFELLIAVILSAQATDKSVNLATRVLFKHANTPQAIADLGVEGLSQYIRTIGLFNSKAKNIIATCKALVVVLNTAFGQPTIAVDTHIFRVANRTGLAPGADVRAVEDHLLKVVPPEYLHDAHHWLILHGRYVCIARQPRCPECVISDLCEFTEKTPAEPPSKAAKRGKIATAIRRVKKKS
jgi:endonuclease III